MDMILQQIRRDFIDYFNTTIIPRDDTVVQEVSKKDTSKGCGILFRLKDANAGPIYYAESFVKALTEGKSIGDIAEEINEIISASIDHYRNDAFFTSELKPNDVLDEDLIVSNKQKKNISEAYVSNVYKRESEELGVTLFLKSRYRNEGNPTNVYVHVFIDETVDEDRINQMWEIAERNTYGHMDIRLEQIYDENIPIYNANDKSNFTQNWFAWSKVLYKKITDDMNADKIYIAPGSPFHAALVIMVTDDPDMREKLQSFVDDMVDGRKDTKFDYKTTLMVYDKKTDSLTSLITEKQLTKDEPANTIEEFGELLVHSVPRYLPDRFQDAKIYTQKDDASNELALVIRINDEMTPTIPLTPFYEFYKTDKSDEAMGAIWYKVVESFLHMRSMLRHIKAMSAERYATKEDVRMIFISKKNQPDAEKELPHRMIHDIMIAYDFYVPIENDDALWTPITNETAETMGFSEEDLFDAAIQNMRDEDIVVKPTGNSDEELYDLKPDDYTTYAVEYASGSDECACLIADDMALKRIYERFDMPFYLAVVNSKTIIAFPIVPDEPEVELNLNTIKVTLTDAVDKVPDLVYTSSIYKYDGDRLTIHE